MPNPPGYLPKGLKKGYRRERNVELFFDIAVTHFQKGRIQQCKQFARRFFHLIAIRQNLILFMITVQISGCEDCPHFCRVVMNFSMRLGKRYIRA